VDGDAGVNGRCDPPRGFDASACTYDACFADGDCAKGEVCNCDSYYGNVCLPGNCHVDSDCPSGTCSPSPDVTVCSPGFPGRPVGFYCHTPEDECTADEQCQCNGAVGACAWQPTVARWACADAPCAG
jgi:hypothetical protein